MIPRECKRLAEVDFPITEVSKYAARDKSICHGTSIEVAFVVGAAAVGIFSGLVDGVADTGSVLPIVSVGL